MKEFILAPSVLSANFACMGKELEALAKGGAKYVHLDVMDGHFVPNISFGIPVVASLKKETTRLGLELFFDTHLMITNPHKYVAEFVKAGSDLVTFHYEACKSPCEVHEVIDLISNLGAKVGLAISPDTDVEVLFEFVNKIDMALIMSVYPGFGGQSFIESALEKSKALRAYAPGLDIQMDGGISLANYKKVIEAGTNIIVVGSAIFNEADVANECKKYMK